MDSGAFLQVDREVGASLQPNIPRILLSKGQEAPLADMSSTAQLYIGQT